MIAAVWHGSLSALLYVPVQLGDGPVMFDLTAVTRRKHDSVADVVTPVKLGELS